MESRGENLSEINGWILQWGGSFKSILQYQNLKQEGIWEQNNVFASQQRLRLNATVEKSLFRAELADELIFTHQTPLNSLVPIADLSSKPAWDTELTLLESSSVNFVNSVDRANVQISLNEAEIILGKQAVATGVGHLFRAVSQVPYKPFILADPEYPVTEDSLSFIWNGSLAMEARFLPKTPDQQRNNFHLRAKGSKMGSDVALTTGRSDDKYFVGLEMAAGVGDSIFRSELVYYDDSDEGKVQGLVGFDRVFSPRFGTEFEIFYNGFGTGDPYVFGPYPHRSTPFRGLWYFGSRLRYDWTDRIKSTLTVTSNLGDPSALFHLSLCYSITPSLDVLAGQYFPIAQNTGSEFGGRLEVGNGARLGISDMTYALIRYYF